MQRPTNIDYRVDYDKVRNIFKYYQKAQIASLKVEFNENLDYLICINGEHYPIQQFVKLIDNALAFLDKEGRLIITNNFLSPGENNWWMEYYSRSSYYRRSKEIYQHFLSLIHYHKVEIKIKLVQNN